MAVVVVIVAVVIVVVADVLRRVLVVRRGEAHDVAEVLRPLVVDGGAVEDFGFGRHVGLHHGIQSVAVKRSGHESCLVRGFIVVTAFSIAKVSALDGDKLGGVFGHISFEELLGNKEEEELSDNNANTENILDNTANDNEAENKEEITTNEEFENINSDEEILEIKEEPMTGHLVENVRAMCAIATQIAIENITSVHYALRVISRMVNSLDDEEEKMDIVEKVCQKLSSHPNSTYTKLWLQNMTYVYDMQKGKNRFDIPLCELVMNGVLQEEITLWNNRWLKRELTEDFPQESIVNGEKLEKVTPVITFRETREYWDLEDLVENLDD